jgi:hypothetical protein
MLKKRPSGVKILIFGEWNQWHLTFARDGYVKDGPLVKLLRAPF